MIFHSNVSLPESIYYTNHINMNIISSLLSNQSSKPKWCSHPNLHLSSIFHCNFDYRRVYSHYLSIISLLHPIQSPLIVIVLTFFGINWYHTCDVYQLWHVIKLLFHNIYSAIIRCINISTQIIESSHRMSPSGGPA